MKPSHHQIARTAPSLRKVNLRAQMLWWRPAQGQTQSKPKNAFKVLNVFADTFCSGFHVISIPYKNCFPWSPCSPECLKVCKFKCQHQWSTCMLTSPAKQRPWAMSHCKTRSLSTSRLLCQASCFNINAAGGMVQEFPHYRNELSSPYFWTWATPQLSGLR